MPVVIVIYCDSLRLFTFADLSNCQYDSSFKGLWHARYQAAMLIGCWTCFAAFQVRNMCLSAQGRKAVNVPLNQVTQIWLSTQVVKSRWHHCGSFFWALQASETALCLAAACALLTMVCPCQHAEYTMPP